jgi:hypothetical protein
MTTIDLRLFENAISDRLCRPCAQGDEKGACCRSGEMPCALTAHTDVVVRTVTQLGRGRTADVYANAFERSLCTTCESDATGHCSLLELVIDKPDAFLLRVVDVVMDVQEAAMEGTGVTS